MINALNAYANEFTDDYEIDSTTQLRFKFSKKKDEVRNDLKYTNEII